MSSYGSGFNGDYQNLNSERRDPGLTAQKKNKNRLVKRKPSLPPKIGKRVQVLRQLEGQHKKLEEQFFKDRAALEDKYNQLYKPLYEKRYEIVNGISDVKGVKTEEQLEHDKANEEKGVPNFWLSALKKNSDFMITKVDEPALRYLTDIKWCRLHDPKGFKLEFLFDANPYFKNSVLTKTYHMIEENEPIWRKEIGIEIEWYPAAEICYGFFEFFQPPQYDHDCTSQHMVSWFKTKIENDHEMGLTIRDKIIPHAVSWFTGEAVKPDDLDDDDDSKDDDDSDYYFDFDSDEEEDDKYEEDAADVDNNKNEEDGNIKSMSGWTNPERAMAGLTLREGESST